MTKNYLTDKDTLTVILEFCTLSDIARIQPSSKFVAMVARHVIHTPIGNTLFMRLKRAIKIRDLRVFGRFISQRRRYFPDQFFIDVATNKYNLHCYHASTTRRWDRNARKVRVQNGLGLGGENIYIARSLDEIATLYKLIWSGVSPSYIGDRYTYAHPNIHGLQCCSCEHKNIRDACCLIYFMIQ